MLRRNFLSGVVPAGMLAAFGFGASTKEEESTHVFKALEKRDKEGRRYIGGENLGGGVFAGKTYLDDNGEVIEYVPAVNPPVHIDPVLGKFVKLGGGSSDLTHEVNQLGCESPYGRFMQFPIETKVELHYELGYYTFSAFNVPVDTQKEILKNPNEFVRRSIEEDAADDCQRNYGMIIVNYEHWNKRLEKNIVSKFMLSSITYDSPATTKEAL